MVRIVKFKHNKKTYEILNNLKPLFETEIINEEVQDMIFIDAEKRFISRYNRIKAQKERRQKEKIAKELGIPYTPKTRKKANIKPQKEINLPTWFKKNHNDS